jgi:hypothetical protein
VQVKRSRFYFSFGAKLCRKYATHYSTFPLPHFLSDLHYTNSAHHDRSHYGGMIPTVASAILALQGGEEGEVELA